MGRLTESTGRSAPPFGSACILLCCGQGGFVVPVAAQFDAGQFDAGQFDAGQFAQPTWAESLAGSGQGFEALGDLSFQAFEPFPIVKVRHRPNCAKVEGNIVHGLGDLDNVASERVGDARFVQDIGVFRAQVSDYDSGSPDQVDDIIHDVVVEPDVISSMASHPGLSDRLL